MKTIKITIEDKIFTLQMTAKFADQTFVDMLKAKYPTAIVEIKE